MIARRAQEKPENSPPRRSELIAALEEAERLMLALTSRWQDMPADSRLQLRAGASRIAHLLERCRKPR